MLKQEGYDLVGAAFEVYNELGSGLLEEIYQQALEIELDIRQITYESKKVLKVYYKTRQLDKVYIPDLFVFDAMMVELKACKELTDEHRAQLINYMKITKTNVGYLVNLGASKELEWERFILNH